MIRIAVNYDINNYSVFIKESKPYKKLKMLVLIYGAFFLLFAAWLIADAVLRHKANLLVIFMFTVLLGCFIGLGIRLLKMNPIKLYDKFQKSNPNLKGETRFENECIASDSTTDFGNKHVEYKYENIESAIEKNGFFIINITLGGYIVFGTKDIIEGTPDELRALLSSKLGAKYRKK
ncbi:hypothetical protein [Ruminococcus sp.]|uniref:hypothetical protein n=1 Tax=Ruminococcus sp. TaxID=41978 RepID=UPI0025ED3A98|nr:hypothetical protein [Ruminococcus sp.]MCR4638998.1 hypothetical protein [Ruminococcus sp.]